VELYYFYFLVNNEKIKRGNYMPAVTKSMDFVNNLNEILEYCQNNKEAVFASNNGQGRFAVMSEETYEELVGKNRIELYQTLQMGLDQINNGEFIEEEEMFEIMDNYLRK
jgi:PHD/YefM family antitoxin component YafN of YafNO toxin-antitoxin module